MLHAFEFILNQLGRCFNVLLLYSSGSQTVVRVPLVVREGLQGGTRIDLLSVFLHKKYIHSCSFYLINS